MQPLFNIAHVNRLAFFGSRSLAGPAVERLIEQAIDAHTPAVIITAGEPRGVCATVIAVCARRRLGHVLTLYHTDKRRARGQYEARSEAVLANCDHCVFIHDGTSRGTANELALCRKLGVAYTYHVLSGCKAGSVLRLVSQPLALPASAMG